MSSDRPMQLGMIGLGRMGANMVRRLHAGRPQLRGSRRLRRGDARARQGEGATPGPDRSRSWSPSWTPPRAYLVDGAGRRGRRQTLADTRTPSAGEKDDVVIDGGNSFYRDDIGAPSSSRPVHFVDCDQRRHIGTRARLLPDDRRRARGGDAGSIQSSPRWRRGGGTWRPPRRDGRSSRNRAEEGYLHCGPYGAGHFVKWSTTGSSTG